MNASNHRPSSPADRPGGRWQLGLGRAAGGTESRSGQSPRPAYPRGRLSTQLTRRPLEALLLTPGPQLFT